jgi:hypothetical protein
MLAIDSVMRAGLEQILIVTFSLGVAKAFVGAGDRESDIERMRSVGTVEVGAYLSQQGNSGVMGAGVLLRLTDKRGDTATTTKKNPKQSGAWGAVGYCLKR